MDSFSEDKENVSMSAVSNSNYFSTGGKESLNNLSLNSYNILASIGNHQTPGSYGGGVDTSMNLNESFSFDGDKLQLDIYQKSIQKLAYENQQLRKRVKHLKDLARSKEEQLIETFNQACEDKMKKEEKTQIEYNTQLQSYYECFLQIEQENYELKAKLDQMRGKIASQQDHITELSSRNLTSQSSQDLEDQTSIKVTTSTSIVDEECMITSTLTVTEERRETVVCVDVVDGSEAAREIDDEFTEMNKNMKKFIENKISEHRKMSLDLIRRESILNMQENNREDEDTATATKSMQQQQRVSELELEIEVLNNRITSIESSLARWIYRACDYKTDADKAREKCSKAEQDLAEFKIQYDENITSLDALKKELEEKSTELSKYLISRSMSDKQVGTESIVNKSQSCQTFKHTLIDSETQTDPITNTTIIPAGIVAQQTAKINNELQKASSSSSIGNKARQDQPDSNRNELNQLKQKVDSLMLEKNSFKVKNDELMRELDSVTKNLESLRSLNKEFKEINNKGTQTFEQVVKKMNQIAQTDFHVRLVARTSTIQCQTDPMMPTVKLNSVSKLTSNTSSSNITEEDKIKLAEFEQLTKEKIDLEIKVNELTSEKYLNIKLKEELTNVNKQLETERDEFEKKWNKLITDFNVSKQVSDTIIQQQKKLLYYLQTKMDSKTGGDHSHEPSPTTSEPGVSNSGSNVAATPATTSSAHHNIRNIFKKSNKNPLLAHLHKTTNQALLNKQQEVQKKPESSSSTVATVSAPLPSINLTPKKSSNDTTSLTAVSALQTPSVDIKRIEKELNSNYVTYSELHGKIVTSAAKNTPTRSNVASKTVQSPAIQAQSTLKLETQSVPGQAYPAKQIHVFLTGLNTCPIYCHVCQKLIPLIAYASKCQLCSFTCHSTCSAVNKSSRKSIRSFSFDPLKYCNAFTYLMISLEYNMYMNKLINMNASSSQPNQTKSNSYLLSDYVFVDNNSKWKKLWISLRIDDKNHLEAKLDIYQKKSNLKPIDTINLLGDKILVETNTKLIQKIKSSCGSSNNLAITDSAASTAAAASNDQANIYEEVNDNIDLVMNFEKSSLIILLYNGPSGSSTNGVMMRLGFTSFSKKNLWYDALLSSMLLSRRTSTSTLALNKKLASSAIIAAQAEQFKVIDVNKVLMPFLELCDTIVNSYCFINDNLIALACDDGLFLYQNKTTDDPLSSMATETSLVKINKVESAHKLYYANEFGKLCFIGRKSRQFLSIDVNELNTCLINRDYQINSRVEPDSTLENETSGANGDEMDDEDEAKSIMVTLDHVHNIDRCYLFECRFNKSNGHWHLAVATPETIFILLFNRITQKYSLVKTIQTQSDSPCLCMKFTVNSGINQLVYACGKEFFKMDINQLQASTISVDSGLLQQNIQGQKSESSGSQMLQPNAICVINPTTYQQQEAILLCYDYFGVFLVYNFATGQWQTPTNQARKASSSSINSASSSNSSSSSNLLQSSSVLRWPRGNGLTPLQIEYDSSFLYLFYNDSVIVYTISFDSELSLNVKKVGIAFVYRPRYLNTLNTNKSSNCIIISNRRLLGDSQLEQEMNEINSRASAVAANVDEEDDYNTLDLDEKMNMMNTIQDELISDLNDKICLSYFTPSLN